MAIRAISPLRNENFVDDNGFTTLPAQIFLETIDSNTAGIEAKIVTIEANIVTIEANIVTIEANIVTIEANIVTIEERLDVLEANIVTIEERLDVLEPTYTVITSADSPYTATTNEYILCNMDGNIDITPPALGRIHISRDGAGAVAAEEYRRPGGVDQYFRPGGVDDYIRYGTGLTVTLTILAVVNGVTNPTIDNDGDAAALAFIGTEYRYV